MSQATHPHSMDAVPAVPAVPERAEVVRRARFTVLDETGQSPYETQSSWPKIALVAVGVGALALGGFFLRGSGGAELKRTSATPAAPAAAPVSDPSRTQAAWAKEQANLKRAATAEAAAPGTAAPAKKAAGTEKAAAPSVAQAPAPEKAAPPVAVKAPAAERTPAARDNSYAAAPIQRPRKASDNPYVDAPANRASDNPY